MVVHIEPERANVAGAITGTILLVDERTLTRQWVTRWLELGGSDCRVEAISDFDQARRLLDEAEPVDLVVVNVGASSASEPKIAAIFECLGELLTDVPVVAISDRKDAEAAFEAMRRGVRAYIPTSLDSSVAIEALRLVQAGGTFVPADIFIAGLDHGSLSRERDPAGRLPGLSGFTRRELQVLDRLQRGQPNKTIAYELDMQESTVKVHVRRIMRKLNATNRTQAAYIAQSLRADQDAAVLVQASNGTAGG